MRYEYPIHLEKQADGCMLVMFPDVPEAVTDGSDQNEAGKRARMP